jgi:hypothetical protein
MYWKALSINWWNRRRDGGFVCVDERVERTLKDSRRTDSDQEWLRKIKRD